MVMNDCLGCGSQLPPDHWMYYLIENPFSFIFIVTVIFFVMFIIIIFMIE